MIHNNHNINNNYNNHNNHKLHKKCKLQNEYKKTDKCNLQNRPIMLHNDNNEKNDNYDNNNVIYYDNNNNNEKNNNHNNQKENELKAEFQKLNGNSFIKKGKYEDAIKCYLNAIKLNPTNSIYYSNLSFAYYKLNNYKLALLNGIKAVKLNQNYPKAWLRTGKAAYTLDYFKETIFCLEKFISLSGNNSFEIDELISESNSRLYYEYIYGDKNIKLYKELETICNY